MENKTLSPLSPHFPNNDTPNEEHKDLTITMSKVENDLLLENALKKDETFTEMYSKKINQMTKIPKGMHTKHDSFQGIPKKTSTLLSPMKKEYVLKIDKKTNEVRTQISKSFYSPQTKPESTSKKFSIYLKETSPSPTKFKPENSGLKLNVLPSKKK